jgi:hypothetical protein
VWSNNCTKRDLLKTGLHYLFMRSLLLWVVTQRILVLNDWRFGTTKNYSWADWRQDQYVIPKRP